MSAPLKRISPELDSRIAAIQIAEQISYVEASRRLAELAKPKDELREDILRLFDTGLFTSDKPKERRR